MVQGTLLIANRTVGLAGIGAIGLAGSIAIFADRVDGIVSQTIYPGRLPGCGPDRPAARGVRQVEPADPDVGRIPFGVGLALFAGDLITFVFGEQWRPAEELLIGLGLIAAANQIAFNWTVFMRALNNTKPIFIGSLFAVFSFVLLTVPALLTLDLMGYVVGLGAATVVQICVRGYFLRRIFEGFAIVRHLLRAVAPVVPAAGLVLLVRLLYSGERSLPLAIAELLLFAGATILFSFLFERRLVSEIWGYLRGRSGPGLTGRPQQSPGEPSRA